VAFVKLELILHLELEEENLGWRKKSLGELLAPSLRKKMTKRWCSSPASSSGGPPAKLRRGEGLPRLDHLGSSSMVSWIEERVCERVNGREREAARGAGQGGDARPDEWDQRE
jgi:hypothetical protein